MTFTDGGRNAKTIDRQRCDTRCTTRHPMLDHDLFMSGGNHRLTQIKRRKICQTRKNY